MPRNLSNILICLLLFTLALVPRVRHISDDEPQPDEIHWEKRSYGVVERYRQDKLEHITTHLNHPGIPPAFIMGFSEVMGEKYNIRKGFERGEKGYVDRLKSSRMGMAITASFIAPVLFLGLLTLIGRPISILAASLFAYDPLHIGLSRMAHLDACLTLLVSLCFFTFVFATRRKSTALYFLSSFFWALCIMTKPTAAAILAGLFAYRIFRKVLTKEKLPIISFLDYWLVYFALAFFTFSYTRLWFLHDKPRYKLDRAGVHLKRALYHYGEYLQSQAFLSYAVITTLFLAAIAFLFFKRRNLFQISAITLSLFLPLFLMPQVVENFVGFWSWVVGLSHEKHVAWGKTWQPSSNGYLEIFLRRTPSLILFAIVIGFGFLILRFRKLSNESRVLYLACIACFIFWLLPLNVSSKQAYRYLMPAVPFVYIIAAFGLYNLFNKRAALCLIPFSLQFAVALDTFPEPLLYFNRLSGGLEVAKARGRGLPFSGQLEALKFLQKKSADEGRDYMVGIYGDATTLYYAYRRLYNGDVSRLTFSHVTVPHTMDYIMVYGAFHNLPFDTTIENVGRMKKVFTHSYKGVPLFDIYEVPIPTYEKRVEFNLLSGLPGHAHKQKTREGEYFLEALPGRTRKGHMVHSLHARIMPGKYKVTYEVGLTPNLKEELKLAPDTHAVTVEFGTGFTRAIKLSELSMEKKAFSFEGEFNRQAKKQIRVYWSGKVPVALYHRAYVERVE